MDIRASRDDPVRSYAYFYDALNRYKSAYTYFDEAVLVDYQYTEHFEYDKMGNITQLHRYGNGQTYDLDHLVFSYDGNQITQISNNVPSYNINGLKEYQDLANEQTEFFYDDNDNLNKDLDREIELIEYNVLNLPEKVSFANGNEIVNTYDAAGRKLLVRIVTKTAAVHNPLVISDLLPGRRGRPLPDRDKPFIPEAIMTLDKITAYIANMEYDIDPMVRSIIEDEVGILDEPGSSYLHAPAASSSVEGAKRLIRMHNPEGYVANNKYYYYRRDHLGNNREVWNASTNTVVQRTQYYPSGLPWQYSSSDGASTQPYKYNSKEFVEAHGLDEYDYGARGMYPAIMRFTTMEPLAEKYYSISPYAYVANNPIRFVDPDGRDWFEYTKEGETEKSWNWHDGSTYKLNIGKDKDGNDIFTTLEGFKAVVVFDGSKDEKLGKDGTIIGDGGKSAKVTIYGIDGKDDIKTYDGLTVSSDPNKYSMVADGDYDLRQEQMQTSPYGKDALTYRVRQMSGSGQLPIEGGERNKATGKSYLDAIFLHRTNWGGRATHSSQGCLIIDGRQWRDVEKQLGKSKSMLLRITR